MSDPVQEPLEVDDLLMRLAEWAPNKEKYRPIDRQRDYLAVFLGKSDEVQGRRVLWDLLRQAGVLRPIMMTDVHKVFQLEGKRDMGLSIIATLARLQPWPEVETDEKKAEDTDG